MQGCVIFLSFSQARLLATIGVTRGFGDHFLNVLDTDIQIKPFLTPMPEVKVIDLSHYEYSDDDVIVMASDGLWDVMPNERAQEVVRRSLSQIEVGNPQR